MRQPARLDSYSLLAYVSIAVPELDPDSQRTFAEDVVRQLRARNYMAYWAGGCVRDSLLGRQPKDYDVATDATPADIREIFGRRKTIPVGAAFGVIAVLGPKSAGTVEVATFRRDAKYSDGRHPDSVVFSTPEEDATRRDFTINGLFFDPIDQEVIDFVGGREDLEAKILRAIGDPRQRFAEDKLRMLRAVRIAAVYELTIDPATMTAIADMADQIAVVSPERIAQEMRLMLVDRHRVRALELLDEVGLVAQLLPEVDAMHGLAQDKPRQPGGDLWDHTLLVMEHLREPSFPLALAALLHDIGKPSTRTTAKGRLAFYDHEAVGARMAVKICHRWRLSRKETERVTWLVRHHMYLGDARSMRWAKLQRMLTSEGIEELLDLHEADSLASTGASPEVEYCRKLLAQPPEELNPPPLVNGHDLIRHGVPEGPVMKRLLEEVRDAQLERRIRSKRDAFAMVDRLLADGFEVETHSDDDQTTG